MRPLVAFDIETYPNYFLIAFKGLESGKVISYEAREGKPIDKDLLKHMREVILERRTIFGFNSRNFDIPLLVLALAGRDTVQLHDAAQSIIENAQQGWQTLQQHNIKIPDYIDHFDVQEPAPGVGVSLKLYGGRMHSKRLQDLPVEPGTELTPAEMDITKDYCVNDLDTTIDLYNDIKSRIELRGNMGEQYDLDLRSKSDAQIAEAVIRSEVEKLKTKRVYRPDYIPDTIKYTRPLFVRVHNPDLKSIMQKIVAHEFCTNDKGNILLPEWLSKEPITIGNSKYQMGIGGLHSCESAQTLHSDDEHQLIDADVASYYPSIILNLGLYPEHLGKEFLTVYRDIVERRLEAKRAGDDVTNNSLKITINGAFGKLGNKWSVLYSPELLLRVTLTGQLSLLMLIDGLERSGIPVVSANTDGIVARVPKGKRDEYDQICKEWSDLTGFVLEFSEYSALYSRDVNNYLAVKGDDVKGKGIFTLDSLMKNPHADIAVRAVINFITKDVPLIDTIKQCDDIRQFLVLRKVTDGAVYKDNFLGKVVRFYWSTDGDMIQYKKNGNKVPKSDGSRPLMELPDTFPDDVDYERYVAESEAILTTLGV